MIIKSFEIEKIKSSKSKFFLLYGENQGLKNEVIEQVFTKDFKDCTYLYEENEILSNENNFFNDILSKSFFENQKLIIINRVTDKIKNIFEVLIEKKIEDLIIVLNANTLEKKSKIRALFEKDKSTICIPFYEDNTQTLSNIVSTFFRFKKIPISQQSINLIVQRGRGDRQNIKNELDKIGSFIGNKGKIEIKDILKLTNLADNYSVSELVDCCLAKNKKRTINILNENNYSLEDCILIIRTFLIKSKRLLKLSKEIEKTQNLERTISAFKPAIFWKDKEILKQQINVWPHKETVNLIYKINEIELLIKKHSNSSINILSDFIIDLATPINN
jgi:DNA polymerase-3 subunit delta|tara:strand:+ start:954 stop:1949 length:996 start_codon:yes stop_codon:yes gene_type:complete